MSLFGSAGNTTFGSSQPQPQPQQTSSLFGSLNTNNTQNKPSLFSTQGIGLSASQQQPQQQQQSGGFFGSSTQGQQSSGSFGSSTQPQQSGGLFGSNQQPQQQSSNLLGGLGSSTQQQQQQPPLGGSIFGGSLQLQQQQPAQSWGFGFGQSQQQPQQGNLLGQSQQQPRQGAASLWQPGSELTPRQKTIPEQMKLIAEKWDPQSSSSAFQYYFYNNVLEKDAPYYRPGPEDDENKWEEALARKPGKGAIPVLGKGFATLGHRLSIQAHHLRTLQLRLHEINNSLTVMLQNHDLKISIRAVDARRRHLALSQRCLSLATKVQVLRNRGYAMDATEEDLKMQLMKLEIGVFDPALGGRNEEIWARMVSIRERSRVLQDEFEKAGRSMTSGSGGAMDEEVMQKAAKVGFIFTLNASSILAHLQSQILEDYNKQLQHLDAELVQIKKEYETWETSMKPVTNGDSRGRQ
ncbi:MAG: hypothetical protein M1827_003445 [Pycnora praestabilis]|nr:MAG: hypothetical protein M1827_003445 [Pycnora praestabilis]